MYLTTVVLSNSPHYQLIYWLVFDTYYAYLFYKHFFATAQISLGTLISQKQLKLNRFMGSITLSEQRGHQTKMNIYMSPSW